jgi:hypothetical protein
MQRLTLTITNISTGYELEIEDPNVKRGFSSKPELATYIASIFTMNLDEAIKLVEVVAAKPVIMSLPILPGNIARL